jgi:hypothetical protein
VLEAQVHFSQAKQALQHNKNITKNPPTKLISDYFQIGTFLKLKHDISSVADPALLIRILLKITNITTFCNQKFLPHMAMRNLFMTRKINTYCMCFTVPDIL